MYMILLASRLRELAFLNKGITVVLVDQREKDDKGEFVGETFHSTEGLSEFIKYLDSNRDPIMKSVIAFEGEKNGFL